MLKSKKKSGIFKSHFFLCIFLVIQLPVQIIVEIGFYEPKPEGKIGHVVNISNSRNKVWNYIQGVQYI